MILKVEKFIYALLTLLFFVIGIFFLRIGFFYSGFFLIIVPLVTIIYSINIDFKNKKNLPKDFLLYIVVAFFLSSADIWNTSNFGEYDEEQIQTKREYFIPKEGHRLYPEGGFQELGILKDEFHGLRTQEQRDLNPDKNTFKIYEGFQGGLYHYDAWLDIPRNGIIYLRAFDLLTQLELSAERLRDSSEIQVHSTNGEIKKFSTSRHFSIYEGDWGEYYGARFELWYLPLEAGAGGLQKLLEDHYIIDGWMR